MEWKFRGQCTLEGRMLELTTGTAVLPYLPEDLALHLEVWSLCSRLTMLFTTKGSARTTAKIALWSVVFLEINFQAAVRRFMADCLSSLLEVAQDLFMHEQGVSRCALA